jgi:uncharacterized membrane protein YoaK (UPF0700 family)
MAPSRPPTPRFAYLSDTSAASAFAFVGGSVDALGWYGLFQIFTGSITGNIVIGAAAIVPDVGGYAPRLIATGVFVCANAFGHTLAYAVGKVSGAPLRRVLGLLLALETLALGAAWIAGAILRARGELNSINQPAVAFVAALYSLAMGLQNVAVLETCDGYPSTTVVTMTLCKVGASLADCVLLGAAAKGLLPPPATAAPGEVPAARRKVAAKLFSAACVQLAKLFFPLVTFALGAFGGAALQYRIGFHSTLLPMGILLVLLVAAWVPHPDEVKLATSSSLVDSQKVAQVGESPQALSPVDILLHQQESPKETANMAVALLPSPNSST